MDAIRRYRPGRESTSAVGPYVEAQCSPPEHGAHVIWHVSESGLALVGHRAFEAAAGPHTSASVNGIDGQTSIGAVAAKSERFTEIARNTIVSPITAHGAGAGMTDRDAFDGVTTKGR